MSENIKSKVFNKIGRYEGLQIKRVPHNTLIIFKKLSKEEFCDDYGMTLKFLIDTVLGEYPRMINDLHVRLSILEGKGVKPEEVKILKTNSGKVLSEVDK